MRALLLATALLMTPVVAQAQGIPTYDNVLNLQTIKDYVLQTKQWVIENSTWIEETKTDLNTLNSYLQLVETYEHFVENPSLANAMGILGTVGLTQDLPVSPMTIMALANGFNMSGGASLSGDLAKLQMLSGFTNGAFAQNHVYTCTGTDPVCIDQVARANGIAGSMGMAQTAYNDIQSHQATIACLRADLSGVTDPAQRETIIAQIGTEQLYIQNELASLTAINLQAGMSQQSSTQRIMERQRQSADAYFNSTQALSGGLTAAPPPPPLFTATN